MNEKDFLELKKKLEGRTIREIKPLFGKPYKEGELRGFNHFIIILDNGLVLEEQDGEYGGNNLSIYESEKQYLDSNDFYSEKGKWYEVD